MKKLDAIISVFTDKVFFRFLVVGTINTLFGSAIMFTCYNVFRFGYWVSSAANYFFGSILSFFLNKNFTFKNQDKCFWVFVRFAINIAACYLVSYGLARPLVAFLLVGINQHMADNISMVLGMCLFVLTNYLTQRFFTFRHK